jgi:hypothetical protein
MDFENLIRFFVVEGFTQELFEFICSTELREVTRTNVILITFQMIMESEAVTLGLKLFSLYEEQLVQNHASPITVLINSFRASPFLLEFKFFFLDKLLSKMNFSQVEKILVSIESHFFPGLTGKSSLLVYQINPIKTAMHLQEFLTKFVSKFPVLEHRVENLKEVVME